METKQAQPVMFCHDSTSIYYPTAPGRVYIIGIAALADCDGSDEDYSDSTAIGSVLDLLLGVRFNENSRVVSVACDAPREWPPVHFEKDGASTEHVDEESTSRDFHDALEQWADWCDRDSVRLDSLDEIKGAIARAA